jgi:hypothetical protein
MTGRTALLLALAAAFPARAVTLNSEGTGQALIYPYYTAQSTGNDAFNTYISVVNHTANAKAMRLRFREGRMSKSVLDMNVYLSPNDVWTGAVVPFSAGTRLLSTDVSCTEPRLVFQSSADSAPSVDFRNDAFSGASDDGAGTGLDRTREGFVEIIEMATLTGASATAVTHNSAGVPSNCGAVAGWSPSVAAPTGGLSGTLTLINVATGLDFNVNAEALDALATRPFFRLANDAYPAFTAVEIDPVSVVDANGATYRSQWTRPVDAVSAVLMRNAAMGEWALDTATASQTDFVLTLPTRHFYASGNTATFPFSTPQWTGACEEPLSMAYFNREEGGASVANPDFATLPPIEAGIGICGASGVASFINYALPQAPPPGVLPATLVLGSTNRGLHGTKLGGLVITPPTRFEDGWMTIGPPTSATTTASLKSTASSTRFDWTTGQSTTGAHRFIGLPMLAFSARVLRNGTLRCDAGTCLGNYGSAFPFKYQRNVTP